MKILREVPPERLRALAQDPSFLRRYDAVMVSFDADMKAQEGWTSRTYPQLATTIAYFSAEFRIHNTLPIYGGGLGILAGDHCKEASDLGLPLVGVGFMYPQGYFPQRLSVDGRQEAVYEYLDRNKAPLTLAMTPSGQRCLVAIPLDDRRIYVQVWHVRVGRCSLYLMDTDVEENPPDCLDIMRGMDADSVDAVVTDPPYGIEFRGEAWDKEVPQIATELPTLFDRVAIIMGTTAIWQFAEPKWVACWARPASSS